MKGNMSEFASTLKTQRQMLCIPIGMSLKTALALFGFSSGQEVLVSFQPGRVEIRPRNKPLEVQVKMKAGAVELRDFLSQMRELKEELPTAPEDELAESDTVEVELLGTLECLITDDLEPAIKKLESVASLKVEASSKPSEPSKPVAGRRSRGRLPGRRKARR